MDPNEEKQQITQIKTNSLSVQYIDTHITWRYFSLILKVTSLTLLFVLRKHWIFVILNLNLSKSSQSICVFELFPGRVSAI